MLAMAVLHSTAHSQCACVHALLWFLVCVSSCIAVTLIICATLFTSCLRSCDSRLRSYYIATAQQSAVWQCVMVPLPCCSVFVVQVMCIESI